MGYFVDATSEPKKVDLIVCLGGGKYVQRGEKTLELFEKSYSKSNILIFTGYTNIKDFKGAKVVFNRTLKNTYEEVVYTKNYMKEHGLKSATFVTEAPHSRRILLFTKLFGVDGDFEFSVVGSKYEWDASNYYKYPHMRAYAFSEVTKMVYNIFLYGVLDSFGLKDWFESNFSNELNDAKRSVGRYIL